MCGGKKVREFLPKGSVLSEGAFQVISGKEVREEEGLIRMVEA